MALDLILAPEEDGNVVVVESGFLGNAHSNVIESEQPAEKNAALEPLVDPLSDLLRSVSQFAHQRAGTNEIEEIGHRRNEGWVGGERRPRFPRTTTGERC